MGSETKLRLVRSSTTMGMNAVLRVDRRVAPGGLHAAVVWVVILTLSLLTTLPCVIHCDREHPTDDAVSAPVALAAWFLCDFPATHQAPIGQPLPHHHHVVPQTPAELALVSLGAVIVVLAFHERLRLRDRFLLCATPGAPLTPPPRPSA